MQIGWFNQSTFLDVVSLCKLPEVWRSGENRQYSGGLGAQLVTSELVAHDLGKSRLIRSPSWASSYRRDKLGS